MRMRQDGAWRENSRASSSLILSLLKCLMVLVTLTEIGCQNSVSSDRHPSGIFSNAQINGQMVPSDYGSFDKTEGALSPSEHSGKAIWYNATAGNSRFHEYPFAQRIAGHKIDWYKFFATNERARRFDNWGMVNDPDCCTPGQDCQTKFGKTITLDDTYGFDYCKGDEKLYPFIGKKEVNGATWAENFDPACFHQDVSDTRNPVNLKEKNCHLEFGQPMGAVGFRKFPNPRFNERKWLDIVGSKSDWTKYRKRLDDFSLEAPFLVGVSCASCHVGFDPAHSPLNPNNPSWLNIKGTVGSQHTRITEIFASGFDHNALERQLFGQARPGTVDTSAVPTDYINNPGTPNAIFNFDKRPTFNEKIDTWRKVTSCPRSENRTDANCWCEPGKASKCWSKSTQTESVRHVLKGGEDSIGYRGAVQRVYINIGSCSEQCWVNHLADYRNFEPVNRNFAQTGFDVGQCRRDCPQFRAIEDRVDDVVSFLASRRPTDLVDALIEAGKNPGTTSAAIPVVRDQSDFETFLEKRFGGSLARGEQVFKRDCARCHSSQVSNNNDFAETKASDYDDVNLFQVDNNGVRIDWLGNDKSTPFDVVKTFSCRAMHSNHMKGHIWQEYASEGYRNRPKVGSVSGGRGYMRNISLLSVWAQAPFLHNNAMGPEICPPGGKYPMNTATYDDATHAPGCLPFDPSIAGRLKLYELSMKEILTASAQRNLKQTLTDDEIIYPVGGVSYNSKLGHSNQIAIKIEKGMNINVIGNFDFKGFSADLLEALQNRNMKQHLNQRFGETQGSLIYATFQKTLKSIRAGATDGTGIMFIPKAQMELYAKAYSTCNETYDNSGHDFGTGLSEQDKNSLLAFMAMF